MICLPEIELPNDGCSARPRVQRSPAAVRLRKPLEFKVDRGTGWCDDHLGDADGGGLVEPAPEHCRVAGPARVDQGWPGRIERRSVSFGHRTEMAFVHREVSLGRRTFVVD